MDELRNRRDKYLTGEDGCALTSAEAIRKYLLKVEEEEEEEEKEKEKEFPSFPDFWSSSKWINVSRQLEAKDFAGRLLVLDFWTFCCINCMHVMPVFTSV